MFNKIGLPLTNVKYIVYIHKHNLYVHIKYENDSIMYEMTALCIHVTDEQLKRYCLFKRGENPLQLSSCLEDLIFTKLMTIQCARHSVISLNEEFNVKNIFRCKTIVLVVVNQLLYLLKHIYFTYKYSSVCSHIILF